jgi:phytoene synthase
MFATTAQLETYCDGVASTVGRLCVRVWGVEDARRLDEALDLATRRGRAFQLTNILRDVAADARSGRLYVPADVLAAQDVSPEALLGWREPTSAAGAITALAQRAAEHYRASAPLEGLIRRDARAALWAMTRIYRGVLRRVETEPRLSVAERRAGLSKPRKVAVAAAAVTRAALGL